MYHHIQHQLAFIWCHLVLLNGNAEEKSGQPSWKAGQWDEAEKRKEKKRRELFNLSFCFLLLIVLRFGLLLYIVVINTGSLYLAGPNEKILGDEEILTYTR